jgi:arylsulfatase A-like enzyme
VLITDHRDKSNWCTGATFGFLLTVAGFGLIMSSCQGNDLAPKSAELGQLLVRADTTDRNVIVVLSDTHRRDYTSSFCAFPDHPTPNVELLARDGVTFSEAYTPVPISAPAYATLMTGVLPAEHGLLNNEQFLIENLPLLQEELRATGYQTAAVVSNPFCSSRHGFARGFEMFWDQVEGRGKEGAIVTEEAITWLEARDINKPFFLFLAYMDAHSPYITEETEPSLLIMNNGEPVSILKAENAHIRQRVALRLNPGKNRVELIVLGDAGPELPFADPSSLHLTELQVEGSGLSIENVVGVEPVPETRFQRLMNRSRLDIRNASPTALSGELVFRCYRRYQEKDIEPLYRSGVRSFDRSLGHLVGYLRQTGLYEDSTIIFVSDHGEMLGEHDAWGHVGDVFQETLRIPLVVKGRGLPPGVTCATRVGLRDVHDLILELALEKGKAERDRRQFETRGRFPFVAATYPPEAPVLRVAVFNDRYKIIADASGSRELFDIRNDPAEERDLFASNTFFPDIESLIELQERELERAAAVDSLDIDGLTQEQRDQLKVLGYLENERN